MNDEQRRLVEENQRLVGYTMARYFCNTIPGREWEDFQSIGHIALCKAAIGYDRSRGKFSSYAVKSIRRDIQREFMSRYRGKRRHGAMLTLDATGDEDRRLEEVLPDDAPGVELLAIIDCAMGKLSEEERAIIQMHMDGWTNREIARDRGCTTQNIQLHMAKIRRKLMEQMDG